MPNRVPPDTPRAVLLLAAAAYAAPPAPQLTARGFAVGVGVTAGAGEDPLQTAGCTEGENCTAVRHRSGWGGELSLQVAPPVLAWVEAASEEVKAPAAEYSSSGFRLTSGVSVSFLPNHDVGPMAWAEVGYGASGTEAASSARRWGVKGGGAARFGRPDGNFVSWVGAEVVVTGADITSTLGGTVDIALQPQVPVNATAGFALFSSSLGGLGSASPVTYFTVTGSVGAELGARFGLGVAF